MPPKKRGSSKSKTKSVTKSGTKKRGKLNDLSDDEPPPKLLKEESFRTKLQNIIDEEEKKRKIFPRRLSPTHFCFQHMGIILVSMKTTQRC
ncbi:UNVERIFIED_CONTAM: hypothetical protein RMT77_014657 [Armadillidium vulgare]